MENVTKKAVPRKQTAPKLSEEIIRLAQHEAIDSRRTYGEVVEAALWAYLKAEKGRK
jgi:hypothetical protein